MASCWCTSVLGANHQSLAVVGAEGRATTSGRWNAARSRCLVRPIGSGGPKVSRRSCYRSGVVCMAPEEEKMTRRSPLDFPIEWERPKPGRRPDIFPKFSPMKTPLPTPLPADPPEEDEEEEEKKEEEEEDLEKEESEEPEKQS